MAPHLWLWCSEATQKTWLCNETASCNAATWCVPPKHAGSAQASPVVWIRKIHVATKGYKSSFKSMFFHISAYRFTYRLSFSEPEWSSQNMAHPTNRCDNKMIQVGMQGQKSQGKKTGWLSFSLAALRGMCTFSMRGCRFCSVKSYLKWRGVDKLTSVVMLMFFDLSSGFRCAMFNVINKFICDYLLQPRTFEYSSIQIFKSIYSIFHVVQIIFTERKAVATEHMDISIQSLLPHLFKIRPTAEPIHNDS